MLNRKCKYCGVKVGLIHASICPRYYGMVLGSQDTVPAAETATVPFEQRLTEDDKRLLAAMNIEWEEK